MSLALHMSPPLSELSRQPHGYLINTILRVNKLTMSACHQIQPTPTQPELASATPLTLFGARTTQNYPSTTQSIHRPQNLTPTNTIHFRHQTSPSTSYTISKHDSNMTDIMYLLSTLFPLKTHLAIQCNQLTLPHPSNKNAIPFAIHPAHPPSQRLTHALFHEGVFNASIFSTCRLSMTTAPKLIVLSPSRSASPAPL
jgi:hypothetical protein